MRQDGWIGVDLDGTLAEWPHPEGIDGIGAPVRAMVERVRAWLAAGTEVRIVTARVGGTGEYVPDSDQEDGDAFVAAQRAMIEEWCWHHLGQRLRVTPCKDWRMVQLWDDRAVSVETNTGRALTLSQQAGAAGWHVGAEAAEVLVSLGIVGAGDQEDAEAAIRRIAVGVFRAPE